MRSITKYGSDGSTSAAIDAVQVFVETLETHGAIFNVTDTDKLRANLDGLVGPPPPWADALSAAVLLLAHEIKSFLALRSVEGIRH